MLEFNIRRKNIKLYGKRVYIRVYALTKYRRILLGLPKSFKCFVAFSNNVRWLGSAFRSYSSIYVYIPKEFVPKLLYEIETKKRLRLKMFIKPILRNTL